MTRPVTLRFMFFAMLGFPLYAAGAQAPSPPDTYVRVSPRDANYLEFTDGSPYIPIGLNMISPPAAATEEESLHGFDAWLTSLSAQGGNYIRVWLSNPFWSVEHEKCGVYDEARARRIDRLLEMCRAHHIRVKMTLEHFRSIGGGPQPWADNPLYNVRNGGPAESMADFFAGEASRQAFRKKIAWYGERFGSPPIVYGWELWNEVNAVTGGDYMDWTAVMLPELHKTFAKNLGMQSLGSFDSPRARDDYHRLSTMPGNDVAQVHRYLDLGAELEVCKGPVDVLAADAVRELQSYHPHRPVLLAESGAVEPNHRGPSRYYRVDRDGMLLHDILFAPFFAGAAGPGQVWHWDTYVAANNLWYHYARFAEVVRGLDPPAEAFQPSLLPHPRLRVYALKGLHTVLLWCRDSHNTWESELKRGEKPDVLKGEIVDLGPVLRGAHPLAVRVYDPWADRWSDSMLHDGTITLPAFSRSLVIRISL
jgi:hypothetical protein